MLAVIVTAVMMTVGSNAAFAATKTGSGHTVTGGWLGSYTVPGASNVFCVDHGHAAPGTSAPDYTGTYQQNTFTWPTAAYILQKWGTSPNADRAAALDYTFGKYLSTSGASNGFQRDTASGHGSDYQSYYDVDQWSVKTMDQAMRSEANNLAGPYSMSSTVTHAPTATDGSVTVRFTLQSASNHAMSGVTVHFAATGSATSLNHTSATTNSSGQVTVSYNLANSKSGGVKATASGLPGTKVDIYYAAGGNWTSVGPSGAQRLVGVNTSKSSATNTRSASRPAAPTSKVSVHKTDANSGAAVQGAKIKVAHGSTTLATGTTNASGNWTSPALAVSPGTKVSITETAAPTGYFRNTSTFTATTTANGAGTGKVTIKDVPQGKVSVIKKDAATGNGLGGAKFAVHKGSATGTVVGHITSSASGAATSGYLTGGVTIGDAVWIVETTAPAGYTKAAAVKATVTRGGAGAARVTVSDKRVFGNASVFKTDSVTGNPLAGVTFTVEVQKVGTSSWVDAKGGTRGQTTESSPGHYVSGANGAIALDGTKTSPTFAYGDKIRFTEVATIPGYKLPPANQRTVTGTIGTNGNLELDAENVPYQPKIGTTATNADDNLVKMVVGGSTVNDEVSYSDVEPGIEYQLSGELFLIHSNGSATSTNITGISDPFTPTAMSGTVTVPFHLPATLPASWSGLKLVAHESLAPTDSSDTLTQHRATHNDNTDEAQTVFVPSIGTTAQSSNPDLGKNIVDGTKLSDTIAYTNLAVGKEYTASGEFQLVGEDGSATPTGITGTATFTPTASSGTVTVEFDVPDGVYEKYAGDKLVAFETVSLGDVVLAIHADVTDKGQTVYAPTVHTNAANENGDMGKVVKPGDTVVDTVTIADAAPGAPLYVSGTAHAIDADGTEYSVDVSGHKVVTPADDGSHDYEVTFTVPDGLKPGSTLVFAETVYNVPAGAGDDWTPGESDTPIATHDDVTDVDQTVYYPKIGTHAHDTTTGSQNISTGSLTDTIDYTNLQPGVEYTATGQLLVVADDGTVSDANVTSQSTFTPDTPSGSTDVVFDVPDGLAGSVLVVHEQVALSSVPDTPVAVHEDDTDTDQYGWVPSIGTQAQNSLPDLGKTAQPDGTVTDTVSYSGVQPGKEYTLTGEFQVVKDGTVTPTGIKGTQTFTPDSESGTVDVQFQIPDSIDIPDLLGQSIVAFETLYEGDVAIAIHADITDTGQTVNVPKIGTSAVNSDADLDKIVRPGDTVIDTVTYTNLVPGKEYTLTGAFQVLHDGVPSPAGINGTATFTPEETSGTVDVTFQVPDKLQDGVAGQPLVAFEFLKQGDVLVAIHTDVTDQAQTVYVPDVHTTATNANTDMGKVATPGSTLTDTVTYSGLQPGNKYTVTGEFQQVGANGKVTPTGVTGTQTFTPKDTSGDVVVTFKVPKDLAASLQGSKWVAFETLGFNGKTIFVHADVTDLDQTVYSPAIGTTLVGPGGAKNGVTPDAKLVDTVSYSGLQPGNKYTVTGELRAVDGTANGKATGITNTVTFTPKTADGTVKVPLQLNNTIGDTQVVAFETVKFGEVTVATHRDITDKGQTVGLDKLDFGAPPDALQIQSGQGASGTSTNPWEVGGGIALLVLLAGAAVVFGIRRRGSRTAE